MGDGAPLAAAATILDLPRRPPSPARVAHARTVVGDGTTAHLARTPGKPVHMTGRADIVDRNGVVLAKTSSFDKLVAYPDIIDPDDLDATVALLTALAATAPSCRFNAIRAPGSHRPAIRVLPVSAETVGGSTRIGAESPVVRSTSITR